MRRFHHRCGRLVALIVLLAGCDSAYYGTMEKFGVYKRDILVDRVADAMESQEEAKEEFESALDKFASVVAVEPTRLKRTYEELADAYDDADSRAADVRNRISAVEDVSEDLFDEWRDEISQITNTRLKSASARKLASSERKYDELIRSMRRAEARMDPVLDAFRDHVLFLKHNLNAQAIASLRSELTAIESDVAGLIREMERAIKRSQAFIDEMALAG